MYQAYISDVNLEEVPDPAQDEACAVGAAHDDPGCAMNAIRAYHARYICDCPANYFIAGPDGEVAAYITVPAASITR